MVPHMRRGRSGEVNPVIAWSSQILSREYTRIDDPELAIEVACLTERNNVAAMRAGLPRVGATLVNEHGLEIVVQSHAYLATAETLHRWNSGDRAHPEDLFPVIGITNHSKRMNDFLVTLDRCTTRSIMLVDTLPGKRPNAMPGHHSIDTVVHPNCIVIFSDAARLHETILAHELGHAWVQYVDDCEDHRVMKDSSDPVRIHQLSMLQSFVLDLKVNQLVREKGFDMSPIDGHAQSAMEDLGRLFDLGFKAPTKREALFFSLQVAAQIVECKRGNDAGLARFNDTLGKMRRLEPDLYTLAMGLAEAIFNSGLESRDGIKDAIDECLKLGFDFTGDPLDLEEELIVPPGEEPDFDKFPHWIPGAYPRVKAIIGQAMARENIPPNSRWRIAPERNHALLSFELPDGTARGPWPIPTPFAEWLFRSMADEVCKMNQLARERQEKMMQEVAAVNAENMARRTAELERLTGFKHPREPAPLNVRGVPQIPGLPPPPTSPFPGVPGRRPYMAGLGRFLTAARLQEMLGGEHPYAYAMNNPTSYTDPSGLQPGLKQIKPGSASTKDPCTCPKQGMTSRTGQVYIDCNCRGLGVGVLPEDGNVNLNPPCGKWLPADGVVLINPYPWGQETFLKIHGQTCLIIDCGLTGRPTPLQWCCYGAAAIGRECEPTIDRSACRTYKPRLDFQGPPIVK